ncbi:MAG: SDR family NAD(P)-dependent oxidoreductase, partial [Spirochaetia bacterium]|nr:SDR family NAD(P)-dependent oxidoreductase [Spirochaetia bacterium]
FGGSFSERSLSEHFLTYSVNTNGVVAVTHAFYSDLLKRPEAHIVFIASASGYIGLPEGATYASSKWAVIGFGESIRLELQHEKKTHMKVTIVCPSYIDTGMFSGVKAPLVAPLLQPVYTAEQIVNAVRINRPYVNLPWIVNWIQFFRGILPLSWFDFFMRVLGVTGSMTHWTGRQGAHKR